MHRPLSLTFLCVGNIYDFMVILFYFKKGESFSYKNKSLFLVSMYVDSDSISAYSINSNISNAVSWIKTSMDYGIIDSFMQGLEL